MKAHLYRNIVILVYVLLLPLVGFAQRAGDLDRSFNYGRGENYQFNFGNGADNRVLTTALQADGKIIIGGDFTTYNGTTRNYIARLNVDGSLDTAFNMGVGANGSVHTTALQADGKIIIAGDFSSYNGTTRNVIARLNTDGSLDPTFNPGLGPNNTVRTSLAQADGKIIIGGDFTSYNGLTRNRIVRLNADGSLDATFNIGTGANSTVWAINTNADGKVVIAGSFTSFNGITRNRLVRLNTDGSFDATFNPGTGANSTVWTTAIQSDGKIIIGGLFTAFNGTPRNRILRLNSDGSIDPTFNPGTGANNGVRAIAIQGNGKTNIVGDFTSFNGTSRNYLAQLNTDGSLDVTFNPGTGANDRVRTTTVQANGKIIIGGVFTSYNGTGINYITRLNTDGNLDNTFNPGTGANNWVLTTAIQPDGKILLGGGFTSYNGTARNNIARLNSDGSLDDTFNQGTGANGQVNTIAIQADGKIIIGGLFTTYNGTSRNRIARLDSDGSLDANFNPGTGADWPIFTTLVLADGKIIIGGDFTTYNGTTRNHIARLNADGSLDATFNPSTGANNRINTTALQANGKIIIGGEFTSYNEIIRNGIARLNADGSLDATYNTGTGASGVTTTTLLPNGKIIIGGYFLSYNNTTRNRIARLNADGSLDATFNPGTGANSSVETIAIQADGKIIIGGDFNSYNGTARNYFARLNSNGSLDTPFDIGLGPNSWVLTTALQADGKILIGGSFTGFNNISTQYIARVHGCTTPVKPTVSGNNTICVGGSTTLTSSATTGNLWSNGATSQSISVSNLGRYSVRVISGACTSAVSDSFRVILIQPSTSQFSQSICQGSSFLFGGLPRTTAGVYLDTLSNAVGCDSIVTLNLTVRPVSFTSITQSVCQGNTYIFGGLPRTTAGIYLDTLSNAVGCDSIVTLNLTVIPIVTTSISQSICLGSSFLFGGLPRTTAGVYLDTLSNAVGCDSIVTLNLTVIPISTTSINQSICLGSSFLFGGLPRTTAGIYLDTLSNAVGCDSIVTLNLTVRPFSSASISQSICQGSTYLFGGLPRTTAGVYLDTLTNTVGCDSIVTLTLTVSPFSSASISQSICQGSTYLFGGIPRTTAGIYLDTLSNAVGCDSIVTLTLTVSPFSSASISQSICQGDTYLFGGLLRTTAGVYLDTLSNAVGCDSIVTLNLTVIPISTTLINQSICLGSSFLFGGLPRTTAGIYLDTLSNAVGCDSIVTLNLTVRPISTTLISQSICQGSSFLFDGLPRTTAGIYLDTLSNAVGCDSIVTLNLTVRPLPTIPTISGNNTFCAGASTTLTSSATTGNLWSTGDTTRTITVNTAGNYSVSVVLGGCTSVVSSAIAVSQITLNRPQVSVSTNNLIAGDSAILTIINPNTGSEYVWSNGTIGTRIVIRTSDTLTVQERLFGCLSEASLLIIITSSKNSINSPKLKLYPNPTTGIVTLSTSAEAESINITNAVGQLIYTTKAQPEMELNLSHLAKGIYLVQVQSNKGISTQRLVIQ